MFKFRKNSTLPATPRTLYKQELVGQVARATGQDQRTVAKTLTATLDVIQAALRSGQQVSLIGFGTFYTREYPKGSVRAVRSGATVRYPAARRPAFRAGDILKRSVRQRP